MSLIASTAKIYPNVRLGTGVTVGEWVVVGLPIPGMSPWDVETTIGDNAVIRSHSVIYAGSRIGAGFQTGHRAVLGPGMEIGSGCSIGTNTVAAGFAKLRDGARVHSLCYVGEFASIHEMAWVGPDAVIESRFDKVTVVAAGAILALRVHLLPGVRVGERALVGTRCKLRQDVPPYRLVIGDPPRAVRSIDQIVSPIAEIGHPYQPDSPDVREANLGRHAAREGCSLCADDWRVNLWVRLQSARAPREEIRHSVAPLKQDNELRMADSIASCNQ